MKNVLALSLLLMLASCQEETHCEPPVGINGEWIWVESNGGFSGSTTGGRQFNAGLNRHGHSDAAKAVVESEKREIGMYEKYKGYYSYGFYIGRKTSQ